MKGESCEPRRHGSSGWMQHVSVLRVAYYEYRSERIGNPIKHCRCTRCGGPGNILNDSHSALLAISSRKSRPHHHRPVVSESSATHTHTHHCNLQHILYYRDICFESHRVRWCGVFAIELVVCGWWQRNMVDGRERAIRVTL